MRPLKEQLLPVIGTSEQDCCLDHRVQRIALNLTNNPLTCIVLSLKSLELRVIA
jgi:hypothetical protein